MRQRSDKGMIFDITRNSFDDGPGIRTVVFFKGCHLRCAWCHNPEGQSFQREMMFYENKCLSCGKCKEVCPSGLADCTLCGKCELYCPREARVICGKTVDAEEVFAEICKDKPFYDQSGGGVTFSGGECMLQLDFLLELLKKCKAAHIHTAVDTAGDVPFESFLRILPYTDLFLYDVKLTDSEKHRRYTGVSNERILENLRKLSEKGKDIIIRVPLIGGVNDDEKEMKSMAAFIRSIHPVKTEILPYHPMGESKGKAIGREILRFSIPTADAVERFAEMLDDSK